MCFACLPTHVPTLDRGRYVTYDATSSGDGCETPHGRAWGQRCVAAWERRCQTRSPIACPKWWVRPKTDARDPPPRFVATEDGNVLLRRHRRSRSVRAAATAVAAAAAAEATLTADASQSGFIANATKAVVPTWRVLPATGRVRHPASPSSTPHGALQPLQQSSSKEASLPLQQARETLVQMHTGAGGEGGVSGGAHQAQAGAAANAPEYRTAQQSQAAGLESGGTHSVYISLAEACRACEGPVKGANPGCRAGMCQGLAAGGGGGGDGGGVDVAGGFCWCVAEGMGEHYCRGAEEDTVACQPQRYNPNQPTVPQQWERSTTPPGSAGKVGRQGGGALAG